MNRIKLIAVGKIKEEFYRKTIEEFLSDIRKKTTIDIIELPDESIPKNPSQVVIDGIKAKEGSKILEYIDNSDYVIVLCIEGKLTDSEKLRAVMEKAACTTNGSIVFVIGGSLGLDEKVTKRGNYKLSFSRMTFPHQMMRVMLMEQIKNITYGK